MRFIDILILILGLLAVQFTALPLLATLIVVLAIIAVIRYALGERIGTRGPIP
jgi:hypothetical protein